MLHSETPENSYLYSMELLIRLIRQTELPLLEELSGRGFRAVSLSVQRDNPAARLYLRLGFRTVAEHGGEWVMRCDLGDRTGAE